MCTCVHVCVYVCPAFRESLLISTYKKGKESNKDPRWYNFNFLFTFIKMDLSEIFQMNLIKALGTPQKNAHT